MQPASPPPSAAAALRQLCAKPAASFGRRLLERADSPIVPFRAFVATAREMVASQPEQTATYLAALVALDMHAAALPAPHDMPCAPSDN